jgi:hypothetical protein
MKSVEGMIACVAITGAVLFAPAQKLLRNTECLRGRVQNAMLAPAPPIPAMPLVHAVLPQWPPASLNAHSPCKEQELARMQARLAGEQARMQSRMAKAQVREQVRAQTRAVHDQVRAALEQARWESEHRGY